MFLIDDIKPNVEKNILNVSFNSKFVFFCMRLLSGCLLIVDCCGA